MKKIDQFRKSIYIIVGILTIISLVFTLCKKVGFCADSENTSVFPIECDSMNFRSDNNKTYDDFITDLNSILGSTTGFPGYNSIPSDLVFRIVEDSGSIYYYAYYPFSYLQVTLPDSNSNTSYSNAQSVLLSNGSLRFRRNPSYGLTQLSVFKYVNGVLTRQSNSNVSGLVADLSLLNNDIFYCSSPSISCNFGSSGVHDIFVEDDVSNNTSPDIPISGHTKGGVFSNLLDSYDMLENSSDVPSVDTTAPVDPSSNAGWFQKILNGIGKVNQSIQSGVLTIGDYIGSGIEKLLDKLNELKDLITGIYNWFTEDFDSNQFQSDLYSIPLISDLMGLYSLVENCGMFDWSDVTPAQSVSFTFDFGGAVLPHSTNTIDFSWYTGNVRFICNALLCTFLVLGLLVTVINQIPNIIGGHSGDKGGGSDS